MSYLPPIPRRARLFVAALLLIVALPGMTVAQDVIRAGTYDNGKMWTFDVPPVEQFTSTYAFTPDAAWFDKARLGALRLPNCSASFVSPYGLVMTNHHCGRSSVAQVTLPGETLLDDGFTSPTLADERPVDGLYVDQLVAIEDVTDEIYSALGNAETDAEKVQARQEAIARVQERIESSVPDGHVVQIVNLYSGGRYSAYTFRRFTDLRLVMAPELKLGYFGGDTDNFTYPRYALDMTFFRVYENDAPYEPEHYFAWSADGADEGDAVFVVGNPGSTLRLETVAQLEWRRDVQEKMLLELLDSRIAALESVYASAPSDDLLNTIFSLKNAQKLYGGRVKGLNDPVIMAKRRDTEQTFLDELDRRYGAQVTADVPEPYLTIVDDLARIQESKRALAAEYSAFLSFSPQSSLSSPTMQRAALAWEYLTLKATGADASALEARLQNVPERDEAIDRLFHEARLHDFARHLGAEGLLATDDAEAITDNVFANSALTRSDVDVESLSMDDPAIAVLAPYMQRRKDFISAFSGLAAQEAELNAQHGRARYDVYGTSRPPDATFSLRIADGVVSSYEYNGSVAPAFTTFHGLYNRAASHGLTANDTGEWTLPERWLEAPSTFNRSTPMNLATTNDIIGGNSGSPLLNKELEVVGLIFDGNIESLPSAFIYQTETARAVAVDSRGMLEALEEVYGMERIATELRTHRLVLEE